MDPAVTVGDLSSYGALGVRGLATSEFAEPVLTIRMSHRSWETRRPLHNQGVQRSGFDMTSQI